ncbi:MFS transporter [Campylobacter jejuni]|uniref:MFS transporter n=1 Tax=Campylobacter jejuni TaxID=197 RepID=UPI00202A7A80|nr:MFS transporter [Campylobacter jejuni]
MALGLILCALVNVLLGFSNSFYAYVGFVIALGVFQGMGVGPSFITLANWYPKKERGIYTAVWNISHNSCSYSFAFRFCFGSIIGCEYGKF